LKLHQGLVPAAPYACGATRSIYIFSDTVPRYYLPKSSVLLFCASTHTGGGIDARMQDPFRQLDEIRISRMQSSLSPAGLQFETGRACTVLYSAEDTARARCCAPAI
jgi:hypothetical protein